MYYQQFNSKIAMSMLSCIDNMTALYNVPYYYGNMMAVVRILMMTTLKLSANFWQIAIQYYRESIKLPTNEDSVATNLVATYT